MTTGQALRPTMEWLVYTRAQDNELLGFLVPDGEFFVPVTIFGYILGNAADRDVAEHVLESVGLSSLAERWWFRLADNRRVAVEIIEASPTRVVLKNVDFRYEGDFGDLFTLVAPIVDDRLTMR